MCCFFFFFQAEDGIRDVERSRGLGDVYKRQPKDLRFLSQEELEAFTTQHGFICYSRVSAKTGEYVQESFEILLKEILHKKVLSRSKKEGIQLVSLKQEKRGGCCS
eukprot:TRINITY_DN2691_c0_g1_i4.p2 TRINITY_DN2691_c0_g1~~TRINITY_DN2691_c0_g1_i4.p2  ORF type:complete len:106 (+),score=37.53 TRINITY_DN2691_c0_g1_i4:77-394(+)